MDDNKYTVCNIKIDGDNCKKDRNICKNCYNINRKKYNNDEKKRKFYGSVNKIENQKSIMLTIMFQHMKTIVMSFLVQAT